MIWLVSSSLYLEPLENKNARKLFILKSFGSPTVLCGQSSDAESWSFIPTSFLALGFHRTNDDKANCSPKSTWIQSRWKPKRKTLISYPLSYKIGRAKLSWFIGHCISIWSSDLLTCWLIDKSEKKFLLKRKISSFK